VTEMTFRTHDDVKRRALQLLLETCKIAMRGNKLKLSHIADDYSNQISEIDGDDLCEEEHGLEISNDSDNTKLEQNLDMLAQAALQNQTLSFSTIMKTYTSSSLTEIQRLIEKDERETRQRANEQEDKNRETQQAIASEAAKVEQDKMAIETYKIDENSRIEELKLLYNSNDKMLDRNNDGVPDSDKLSLDYIKHREKLEQDMIKIEN